MSDTHTDFPTRKRNLTDSGDARSLAGAIHSHLLTNNTATLRTLLDAQHPADLADAMAFLDPTEERTLFGLLSDAEAAIVLDEVDDATEANLVASAAPEKLARILTELPSDEGADIVGGLAKDVADRVLALTDSETALGIRTLLAYPKNTAGGIMSLGYVDVPEAATQDEAIARFREKRDAEHIFFLYVVDARGILLGAVDLRSLLSAAPEAPVRDLMHKDLITVQPECDQEQVAAIFARYDLTALPVVSDEAAEVPYRLLGIITADDIIDVIEEEAREDVAHFTGSDAEELEKKSPIQVARLRLPWIMATMFIELLAGFVIRVFNPTLDKYLLLASFMPIISAISGNTGLQSAAIIIRGLSTGQVQLAHWKHAVVRQVTTTMILGGACAATLGIIGGVWDHRWAFGVVVFLGMFLAVNIAGIVGTIVPLISKRAGYDPALTAGPFETAFQDVIGISIFLSLATLLLRVLH